MSKRHPDFSDEVDAVRKATEAILLLPLEARPRALRYLWDRFVDHPSDADIASRKPKEPSHG